MIVRHIATDEDAVWIGMHLREDDQREIQHLHPHMPPVEVVVRSYLLTKDCWTMWDTKLGLPVGIFGCSPDPEDPLSGCIWFLGTDDIRGKPVRVLRAVTPWLDAWCRQYPHGIHNIVDARNDLHVRWCRLAGFRTQPFGEIRGVPFIHIHRSTEATPLV